MCYILALQLADIAVCPCPYTFRSPCGSRRVRLSGFHCESVFETLHEIRRMGDGGWMGEAIGLFLSTVLLRPYVFLFLALYLWAAAAAIGWRRTALFTAIAWAVAFTAEYSSTRNGSSGSVMCRSWIPSPLPSWPT